MQDGRVRDLMSKAVHELRKTLERWCLEAATKARESRLPPRAEEELSLRRISTHITTQRSELSTLHLNHKLTAIIGLDRQVTQCHARSGEFGISADPESLLFL